MPHRPVESLGSARPGVVARVEVQGKVCKALGKNYRVFPDPLKRNSFILPDNTIVQMTDLSFHMDYIRLAISWDILRQLKYLPQLKTPFTLEYMQRGSSGNRMAVLSMPLVVRLRLRR